MNFDADAEDMFRRICTMPLLPSGPQLNLFPGLVAVSQAPAPLALVTPAPWQVSEATSWAFRPLKACGLRQLRCTFARVGKVDATVDEGVTGGVESHIFGLDAGHVIESAGRATLSAKRLTVVEAPTRPAGDAAGMLFSLHSGAP